MTNGGVDGVEDAGSAGSARRPEDGDDEWVDHRVDPPGARHAGPAVDGDGANDGDPLDLTHEDDRDPVTGEARPTVAPPPAGAVPAAAADTDEQTDASDDESDEHEHKRQRSFWRELPVLVVVALVLAFLIKTFLVQAFYIPSESMEDTLLIGDRVLVNKLAYRIGDVERGDVIVFDGTDSFDVGTKGNRDSGNAFTRGLRAIAASFGLAPGDDNDYIKRVIGIGGDHVVCCDGQGRITVNGTPLEPEDYLFPGDKPSNIAFDITVPEDRVWVMGDHRSRSEDSRAHQGNPGGGTVPVDHIVGRAFVVVWPFNRFDTLTRPEAFDKIAAGSG